MSVISKRFAEELTEKEMRDAYVESQTRAKVALQIRALRGQRNISQAQLGDALGKTQGNIARLEDINVARYTLSTLFELASAFDVALLVEFASYKEFMERTCDLTAGGLEVPSFDNKELLSLCEETEVSPSLSPSTLKSGQPVVGMYPALEIFAGAELHESKSFMPTQGILNYAPHVTIKPAPTPRSQEFTRHLVTQVQGQESAHPNFAQQSQVVLALRGNAGAFIGETVQ